MSSSIPILELKHIHKRFPGVRALSDVSLRLFPGEVHALMGENGAGKSTLIKVLTGVYSIDEGMVEMSGNPVVIQSPLEAQAVGISTVYQEVNLCPNLTVAENIFIGREPRKFGKIVWKDINRQAEELLRDRLQLSIDVTQPLESYSVAVQQLIAIARALNISAHVLILDEPTSSLDQNEVQQLFQIMSQLRKDGLAILFVTHFLDQMYDISDRVTILRNGEWVGEFMAEHLTRLDLVLHMIGKDLNVLEELPHLEAADTKAVGQVLLKAEGLGRTGGIKPFDLFIRTGEVVGLAGLLGSGRTEMARLFFGADKSDSGKLILSGREGTIHSPREAIEQRIAFCSENRKTEGIIGDLTVRENIILALQAKQGIFRTISRRNQLELAEHYIRMLNINPPNPEHLVKNLSGGNQQKVLLARCLLTEPQLLILDEPTRGIDIGAKTEIQKLVLSLSRGGMSVLFISSEIEEVLRVSDRVAIMRDRHKVDELSGADLNQQQMMKAIAGG
ncbi:sugar ABC transporter ATP-binding protein [Paenibacillus sp. NPDC056933]|uniref:sugar ABC transporter ATP-binding protein n=1 Tax=Paenibacillus sp. NPDC056933 TaxID=3345968 RepID=UPI0036332B08